MDQEPILVQPVGEAETEALIAWLVEKDYAFSIDYGEDDA